MKNIIIILLFILVACYKKYDINAHISVLSYIEIAEYVPTKELMFKFLKMYNPMYIPRIQKIMALHKCSHKPVYAIKKYNDRYEYELYFYRYNPKRPQHINISLDDRKHFPSKDYFDGINKEITKKTLYQEDKYIILSFDIKEEETNIVNFYYGGKYDSKYSHGNTYPFFYYILEESHDINRSNEYGLIEHVLTVEQQEKLLVNEFCTAESVVFFCKKKESECVYIENMVYERFMYFLFYFQYDKHMIDFCTTHYDNTYKFCVSYDFTLNGNLLKTTIFSILY
jgi:hypothetical protein